MDKIRKLLQTSIVMYTFQNLNTAVNDNWLCWGVMTHQPLWVILCRLPEKGRKEIEEIVEEMNEKEKRKRNRNKSGETEEKVKTFPLYPYLLQDSRPCPTVSQYQLDASVTSETWRFRTTLPPSCKWQSITWPWPRQKVKLRNGVCAIERSYPKVGWAKY